MKRNLLQILTLCLCVVLLITTVIQGRKLEENQMELEYRIQNMENNLNSQIQNITWNIEQELEAAAQIVSGYTLEPVGIDSQNHALLADVSVTLKQWYEDTEVTLLAEVGGIQQDQPMTSDGNGSFSAEILLPMDGNQQIILDAQISGGGLTRREPLESWGDCTMLLPLRYSGGGWSGPDYRDGVLSSNFSVQIETQWDQAPAVANAEFLIYRNGELVETLAAIGDPDGDPGSFRPDTPGYEWQMACEAGDSVEIRFRFEDEFGLGYDYLFQSWIVEGETSEEGVSYYGETGSAAMELYWP